MKRKRLFVYHPKAKKPEEQPPPQPIEYPTYVDDQGRTVKKLPTRYAETDEMKYTAKPKGRAKRE